jgi:hypothetical protein
MREMPNDYEVPDSLANRFSEGRVVLFVGSGCSRTSGLPGWKELLEGIINRFSTLARLCPNWRTNLS